MQQQTDLSFLGKRATLFNIPVMLLLKIVAHNLIDCLPLQDIVFPCSCFLLTMKEDSIEGIYDTLKQCALISKSAGGIGVNVHCIRATGSYIAGTNGISNGLVPMLRVFNNTGEK